MITNLSQHDKQLMIEKEYWTENHPLKLTRFKKIQVPYWDFKNRSHQNGQIIMLDVVSESVERAFNELYHHKFPIKQIKPHHEFNISDTTGKLNSTNGLQRFRKVVSDDPSKNIVSLHSFGLALDINYFQNPFIGKSSNPKNISAQTTESIVWPKESIKYLNPDRIAYIEDNNSKFSKCHLFWPKSKAENLQIYKKNIMGQVTPLVRNILYNNGFIINGAYDWHFPIDLHHFQAGSRPFCEKLASVDKQTGQEMWANHLRSIRKERSQVLTI
ncbi:MAG: M15 family metallopeptidase [Alphaproteobacteria bacterium]|nr:M15 family metallopeptidase [Alphaproteobacteria bacterium]MCV6599605.1 M15 family metallopeptidase [Alphaproteobacteria bacterium]